MRAAAARNSRARSFDDLRWLGLLWEEPVRRQSEHFADYADALGRLEAKGVLYPCFCTRKEIAEEIAKSHARVWLRKLAIRRRMDRFIPAFAGT